MAPTICSEKKQLRETRRHHGVATAAISSSSSTASTASSSSSTAGSTAAAAATQASSVLNYVAKGSMNSTSRRRPVRLQRRMPHILARVTSFSTDTSSGVETEVEMDTEQRMQLDEDSYSDARIQVLQQQPHSSSDNNIKTVLQPTTASGYNSKHNRSAKVKICDREVPLQMEDDDDGDSGYEYSQDPIKEQNLYNQNSEGLLSIAIKTIKLVQRNKLLQKRLAQLQLETSEFIASVLANPENRQFREKISTKSEPKVSNMLLRH
ncbi:DNA (cytosine-5)-methyltransferase 1 [Drosophila eugracilis]|uniref:DNA (cytosine-5)-methyltransferase 1 n=1 Tax=Drosophila eugracilis TaxID=29029 RepID=UPI001BDA524C|nr:DNA (cytosine-5)-methyltransferase 1 [Drosophila eugracilis]